MYLRKVSRKNKIVLSNEDALQDSEGSAAHEWRMWTFGIFRVLGVFPDESSGGGNDFAIGGGDVGVNVGGALEEVGDVAGEEVGGKENAIEGDSPPIEWIADEYVSDANKG